MVHQVRVPAPHVQADASSIRLTGDTVGMGIGVGSSLYLRRDVGTVWFRPRRAVADIVVTGEGRFDAQSAQGKVTGRLMELAAAASKPVVVFAGQAADGDAVRTIASIEPEESKAMENAATLLTELAAAWAAGL